MNSQFKKKVILFIFIFIFLLSYLHININRVTAAANLVAAYSFDEGTGTSVNDSSGSGNNGTINGAAWSNSGKYGKALSFNGSSNYVTVNDSNSLDLTSGMTIEAWVNPSNLSGWRSIILKEQSGNLVYSLYGNTDTNRPSSEIVTASNVDTRGTAQVANNTWTHLAATYDGTNLIFYVNGSQVSTRAISGVIKTSTNPLRIGGNTIWGEYFSGLIDEVRIYNRALSAGEIQTDMNTSIGSVPTPTAGPSPTPTITPTPTQGPANPGQWGSIMNWPIVAVHAILMNTGKVLMWDGWEIPAHPRVWDPSNNSFSQYDTASGLFCSGHSTLSDGRVLVDGGHSASVVGIKDTNIFNPSSNSWSRIADMNNARWYPSTNTLGDGRIVTISGQKTSGDYADNPEVYNPTNNTWSTLSSVNTGYIHDEDYPLSFLIPNGKIFVIGQISGRSGYLDVSAPSFTNMPTAPVTFGSATMYRPGKIIISGGGQGGGTSDKKTAVIDLNLGSPSWRTTSSMSYGRYLHNFVVLPDGKVMVVGGASVVDKNSQTGALPAELWDPNTETWSTLPSMTDYRMYHSVAMLMPDARVLSAGGGRFGTAPNFLTAQYFSPYYLFKGTRPTISSAPSSISYNAQMNIQTPDADSIASVSFTNLGSVTHTLDMNQHFVELSFTKGTNQLTVTSPANSNIAPPGHYMLFILNSNGVPSVAKIIQLTQSAQPTPTATGTPVPTNTPTPTSIPNTPTPTPTINPNSLVMAFGFNEGTGNGVGDSSGTGNNGTLNGATWSASGKYGKALSFNGSSNYVTVNDSNSLDLTNKFTIEAWVNPTTLSGWRSIVVKEQPANLVYGLYANSGTNRPSAEVFTTGNFDTRGSAQLALNTWSHVAATYDGTTLQLFVNGNLVNSRALTGSVKISANALRIGGNTIWGEYFSGLIDEVRIYNRVLTTGEISTDMNTGI